MTNKRKTYMTMVKTVAAGRNAWQSPYTVDIFGTCVYDRKGRIALISLMDDSTADGMMAAIRVSQEACRRMNGWKGGISIAGNCHVERVKNAVYIARGDTRLFAVGGYDRLTEGRFRLDPEKALMAMEQFAEWVCGRMND